MATVKPLTSWSYSRYNDWKQCPLKAKLKHIDKIKEPGSPAMDRGAAIHTQAEQYLKGLLPKLPAELALFKDEFNTLRKLYKKRALPMVVEDNWAFTTDWDQTRWDDWANCWVRIKLDCAHFLQDDYMVITDWKTGKLSTEKAEEYLEQMQLYALASFLLYPQLNHVQVRLAFTDAGKMYPEEPLVYERADLKKLMEVWGKRVKPMMSDTKFVAKPNNGCRWCFYGQAGKAKGGPGLCKY